MKTDVVNVSSKGLGAEAALEQVEKASAYLGLTGKDALHLRLLAEEMLGMMYSLTGESEGKFWIEDDCGSVALHLQVSTVMNSEKREQLLDASTSKKNEAAKGLMGRLRDFFDRSTDTDVAALSSPLLLPEMYDQSATPLLDWEWSMVEYEEALDAQVKRNEAGAKEAWDELEKSVVTHVADDIKVSIRGPKVEMIILKRFA